jgi:excisionase family DNA binding protein
MTDLAARIGSEARKQQIVQAALETIGEYGVPGATISRIAKGAGITSAALYSHFENRRAILVAALDQVYEQIMDSFVVPSVDDPIELFREICRRHAEKVLSQDKTSHAHLFLEFVASAPEEGLREVLREKELETTSYLTSVVRGFQHQGRLPQGVDAETIAWLVAGWAWTGDVANLMDASTIWHEKVSSRLWQGIVDAMSGRPGAEVPDGQPWAPAPRPGQETAADLAASGSPEETDYDGLPQGAVFTVEEAASILKVSPDTIDDLLSQKRITSLSVGSETRIPRRTLVALLRGMTDQEFESFLDRRAVRVTQAPG